MSERFKEISSYIPSWSGKPKAQVVEEIASYSLETKRTPDPYYFEVGNDRKLISPQTGIPVEKSVERSSALGNRELEAFLKIQDWAANFEEGIAVWISPPHKDRSQLSKIIISDIRYQGLTKMLFNRAILLDINGQDCLELAKNVRGDWVSLDSPEDLRSNPLFMDGWTGNQLVNFLETNIRDTNSWQVIREGEDLVEKEKAIAKANYLYDGIFTGEIRYDDELVRRTIEDEIRLGTFGSSPVSCPPTAFEAFYVNSFKPDIKYVRNCGNCGRKIDKPISKGYRCVCGGVYEGC